MRCEVCQETEIEGVQETEHPDIDTALTIALTELGHRNWIQCESCSRIVCLTCCTYPKSGYCDPCIQAYRLLPALEESSSDIQPEEEVYGH